MPPPLPSMSLVGKKWEILHLANVRFMIEPGFLLFMALCFALLLDRGAEPELAGLFCFFGFFSLLIHEAGHALCARAFGLHPVRVTLVMFGGHTTHPPTTRGRALLITICGPLGNLLLAGLLWGVVQFGADQLNPRALDLIDSGIKLNLFWLLFNILPVMPLDGGQILFHLLSFPLRVERALAITASISVITSVVAGFFAYQAGWIFAVFLMAGTAVNNYQILRALRGPSA